MNVSSCAYDKERRTLIDDNGQPFEVSDIEQFMTYLRLNPAYIIDLCSRTVGIGEKAWVANVGDSRMYVVGKEIKQVTRDHSLVEEMVRMGEIAKDAAKDHPDKNIITRAVGAADKVVADFFQVNLEPQDYILICTDGLTNMVEDQDIRSIINSQRDVAECAERLVRTANDNGGKDNITVVVIEPF